MASVFKVTEAAALGLHSAAVLAGTPGRLVRSREIAKRLRASEAHLAKVMLQLRRAGIIESIRGPAGGSRLARPPERITLKQIYEAIEGPAKVGRCMFDRPVCGLRKCLLGTFLRDLNDQFAEKLKNTPLSEFTLELGGRRVRATQDNHR